MRNLILATFAACGAIAAPYGVLAAENTAIFAGGCFWCMESDFEAVPGVGDVVSGYTGGELENPTYENHGNHVEAVRIPFDDEKVGYDRLLEIFWRNIDPVDAGGQFCDRGHSYTTAIFAVGEEQMKKAEASKATLDESGKLPKPVVTPVRMAGDFTIAEDYHQDYYEKNPLRYKFYRYSCGRDNRLEELWGPEAGGGIEHDS